MDPLESLVCRITGAQRAVRGERIQSLWSGYGELVRMTLEGVAISEVVVKHAAPPASLRRGKQSNENEISHARKLRSYAVEMDWYQRHAVVCDNRCRVPRLLGVRHEGDQWVFVMEDLDAAGFFRRPRSPDRVEIEGGLRWLAEFHATFLGTRPEGLWSVGTYWHLGTRRNELARIGEPILRAAAGLLDTQLNAARFKTLVHGDAKLDNFCFANRDSAFGSVSVAAVDFQYVGGGCGVKDVAYFFSSIWNPSECSAYAEGAIGYYFEAFRSALARRKPDVDGGAIETEWRRLYPVAWADFQRFLSGWAPGQYDNDPYAARMLQLATANPSTPPAMDQ